MPFNITWADDGTYIRYACGWQRRVIMYNARYLVFTESVDEGDNPYDIIYKMSTDGAIWTVPPTGNPVLAAALLISPEDIDICVYGSSVYLVYVSRSAALNNDLLIKKGTISAGGVITWGGVSTVHAGGAGKFHYTPSINRTVDGHLWIAYGWGIGVTWGTFGIRSTNVDDETAWDAPVQAVAESNASQILPLTNTTAILIHPKNSTLGIDAYPFNGAAFSAVEAVTNQTIKTDDGFLRFGGVHADDQEIHIGYVDNGGDIGYSYRDIGGTWHDTPNLEVGTYVAVSMGHNINNVMMAFREDGDNFTVFYKRKISGIWQTKETLASTQRAVDNYYSFLTMIEDTSESDMTTWLVEAAGNDEAWLVGESGVEGSGTSMTIGSVTIADSGDPACERILGVEISGAVDFATKSPMGLDMPIIEGMYVTSPRIYKIIARVGSTKRDSLQTEKNNHGSIYLSAAGIGDWVKFEDFDVQWAGDECYSCPWLITMIFISIPH